MIKNFFNKYKRYKKYRLFKSIYNDLLKFHPLAIDSILEWCKEKKFNECPETILSDWDDLSETIPCVSLCNYLCYRLFPECKKFRICPCTMIELNLKNNLSIEEFSKIDEFRKYIENKYKKIL